eukprot:6094745-Amphidinium_carterae.1
MRYKVQKCLFVGVWGHLSSLIFWLRGTLGLLRWYNSGSEYDGLRSNILLVKGFLACVAVTGMLRTRTCLESCALHMKEMPKWKGRTKVYLDLTS